MLNSIIPWLSVTVEIVKQMKLQSSDLQTKNLKTQKTGVGTNVLRPLSRQKIPRHRPKKTARLRATPDHPCIPVSNIVASGSLAKLVPTLF